MTGRYIERFEKESSCDCKPTKCYILTSTNTSSIIRHCELAELRLFLGA